MKMSRPNKGRTLGSERTLARRVAYERTTRGLTYAQLAQEMTSVGCAIRGSALYKIENNEPPRRVTVDELVALSLVFEIALDELLVPYELVIDSRGRRLVQEWTDNRDALDEVQLRHDASWTELVEHMHAHPESRAAIEATLSDYARAAGAEQPRGGSRSPSAVDHRC